VFSKDGEAALQRNGGETRAPKNSYGCKHCAMKDMNRVSVSEFNFYLKEGEAFHDERCSGKNCPHGLTGKHWPIKKLCGDQWQAYWCRFGCSALCNTYFCVECGEKRLEKEESIGAKEGRCRRGTRASCR